jgi:dihydroflavonol-4-reductase
MTVLITGASGFVGSAVLRRLLADNVAVRALVRPDSDRRNLHGLDVELVTGDLGDRASLARAVRGCEALFHVAADYRLWTRDTEAMMRTNIGGSRDIVREAAEAGADRIVYTSSVATLGLNADGAPADEDTAVSLTDMIGPYKQSKFLAEEEVRRLAHRHGAPVVIVNPSMPVGPRDIKPTPTGRMIVEAASGRMPAFVDTGLNVVHVDDVADGHLMAWRRGEIGERYVLGGDNMALRDILAAIAALVGRRAPRFKIPHGAILPIAYGAEAWTRITGGTEPFVTVDGIRMARKKMFYTSDRAERELGYRHRPAAAALGDAVAWFRENGDVP